MQKRKKCDLEMLISSLLYLLAPNISEFSERVNVRILLCESLLDQVDCRYIPAVLIPHTTAAFVLLVHCPFMEYLDLSKIAWQKLCVFLLACLSAICLETASQQAPPKKKRTENYEQEIQN